jgi:hypothetical protein
VGACVVNDEVLAPEEEEVSSASGALETFTQAQVDNAYSQASNSANDFHAGKMTGPINGRQVAWKTNPWSSSSAGQNAVCTYGWCGFWPIGDCSKSSGDSNAGYSYGACNSTAWGERFAGFLWNNAAKANYKTKVSGTTTFGYHPYWCFKYDGAVRTYHGWSYSNHCGSKVSFEVGGGPPPPPVCGNGTVETGEQCDQGAQNGTFGTCCGRDCQLMPSGAVCRESMGDCDKADTCSGTSATCSADAYEASGVNLLSGATCTTNEQCQADYGPGYTCAAVTSSTKKCWRVCRDAVGVCDYVEYCQTASTGYGDYTDSPGPSCGTDWIKSVGSSCSYNGQYGTCSANGMCDTPALPTAWICDDSWWGDGKCDCGCGALDFECTASSTVYQNCPGGEQCAWNQATCVSSNLPVGWGTGTNTDGSCAASQIGDSKCDCGCGGVDPDCDKLGVKLYERCASGYSCSWGEKTCRNSGPAGVPLYIYQNGHSRFGNCPRSYSTDGDCDIGCQFKDTKCGGPY